ncbi:hypothetical protein EHS15_15675, partial [Leptospira idonii]
MERQFEQASQATTEAEFEKAVGRGLGILRSDWETRAEQELEKELRNFGATGDAANQERNKLIEEKALAYSEWESEVQEEIDQRKGFWKAHIQSASLDRVWDLVDRAGLILGIQQADLASKQGSTATDRVQIWDTTVGSVRAGLQANWEAALDSFILEARGGVGFRSGEEQAAFEFELSRIREYYISEYEYEESSLLSAKRMYFVSSENRNEEMASRIAQETNPSELARLLVERTKQQLAQNGGVFVSNENSIPTQVALNFQNGDEDYQKQVLTALEKGQEVWQKAIDEMILGKLQYDRDVEMQWRSGESDWTSAYTELVKAREEWLTTVKKQIQEGLSKWEASESTMVANKTKAIEELDRTLETNRTKWESHVRGITDVLIVGADTLATIASNKEWYREALGRASAPNSGYSQEVITEYSNQYTYWLGLESRYRNLVAASQSQIHDQDIRGTGVGQGLLYNAGGSDPYVLTVQEFELKLAREELKVLEEKRDRAKAVYDYAVGNVAQKTTEQITAELDAIRVNFKNKEAAYLSLLAELNGGGSSVFGTPGLDGNSSIETEDVSGDPDTILARLEAASQVLETKRQAMELAKAAMGEAMLGYESALKIQVLIQNPGMLGEIGDLTTDSSKIKGNSGLRGEILQAQAEIDAQREVLRQQEKKMYELQYERENAFRSQRFYGEMNLRVLEFERLKENRLALTSVLNGDGSLEEKIDSLLSGDTLVQLYGNQVSAEVRKNLESWKSSLSGLDTSVVTSIGSHDSSIAALLDRANGLNLASLDAASASIGQYTSQYGNILNGLYSDSRLDAGYLNAEAVLPAYEHLTYLSDNRSDVLAYGKEGISLVKEILLEYKTYADANTGNRGSLEYASKIAELEKNLGYAVSLVDVYNKYLSEVDQTVRYLNANVLDALSKTDVLVDATLTGTERQAAKTRFASLRTSETSATQNLFVSLGGTGSILSSLSEGLASYGQASLGFRNALEGRNSTTKQVSDGLMSLFDGFELEYRNKEIQLKFLLDENGNESKLADIQKAAELSQKVAGAEVNAKALEFLLSYVKDLREGERGVESIYLRILKDSEVVNRDSKTDAASILNRRAMATLLDYFRQGKSALGSYLEGENYSDFITELERQKAYSEEVLNYYESGIEFTAAEREDIRWNGSPEAKKLLSESYGYGSTFFFQGSLSQIGREVEISRRVGVFADQVKSGEVLSVLKEEYFRNQENKATGLLKELHTAVSGLDAITASKLYNDSFVIGSAGDRDLGEEARLSNILAGYLSGATTATEKLNAILDYGKLIEVFGETEGVRIYNEIYTKMGAMDGSVERLYLSSQRLEPGFASVEAAYPSYASFFSGTNRYSYAVEIQKINKYLAISEYEDLTQPIYDTSEDPPVLTGYEKLFSGVDASALLSSKESLSDLLNEWDTMESELGDAFTAYQEALSNWRSATPGTEEYADLAATVSNKLRDLSEKQAASTDYLRELSLQLDEASDQAKVFIAEFKGALGVSQNQILVTDSSLTQIRGSLPGLANVFDDPAQRDKFYYYPIDGAGAFNPEHMEMVAELEYTYVLQKTTALSMNDSLTGLSVFGEAMMFGSTMSNEYSDLYANRSVATDAANAFVDSLEDRIVVYASQSSMNQISQSDLVQYTRNIKEFLTVKMQNGEEINASLWEALGNVEAYTNEIAGLQYYQSLSASEKADKNTLKTEYETVKTAREALDSAGQLFAELKRTIDGLEANGLPLDQSLGEIGAAIGKYEALKEKFTAGGYTADPRIEEGFSALKAFAWQNHKDQLAKAYVNTVANNGTIEKFLADIRSGKFVLPGPSGNIEKNANFLGAALTETEVAELQTLLTGYDFQVRILQSQNLSQVDTLLSKYDSSLHATVKEEALRESYNRIQQSIANGVVPNPSLYPAELKNYILASSFEAYAKSNLSVDVPTLTSNYYLQMNLGDSDRSMLGNYIANRDSKNPSTYLPDSLKEYHLLDTYYANWTGDMDPEDSADLASWLNTKGYDASLMGSLQQAARMDLLVRSYSGEDMNEYITSANNRLSSPVTDQEKEAILLSRVGLYNPTRPGGTDPYFQIQAGTYLRSFTYQTGFASFADALGEETSKLAVAGLRAVAEEKEKKFAWDVSNKVIKIESYLSYTKIAPAGQAAPSEDTQVTNRLRELEYQAEHRLGNFLSIIEEYNSYSYDPSKEAQNPSLRVLLGEMRNAGYTVRDEVYSKNASLEYEFLGGFDNAKAVTDNYVKNNLPGRFALEDPYEKTSQAKGSMSSSASSILLAGEEIGVIYNIKNTYGNGSYHTALQAYKDQYNTRLTEFDAAHAAFQAEQTNIAGIQAEYSAKQEQVSIAYDLLQQASKEMSLLSSVYDFVTIKDYSNHQSLSGESLASLTTPIELIRKRYEDAQKEVTAKLQEITALQKKADDRMKLSELQADTAVAANKAQTQEWAERAMRYSEAETRIKNEMQSLQEQILAARSALSGTMGRLVGSVNTSVLEGRLDFQSGWYTEQEQKLRSYYNIANGILDNKIGAWDFIHSTRGGVDPNHPGGELVTFSGGLTKRYPDLDIGGFVRRYMGGTSMGDVTSAQKAFDGVWIFNLNAGGESAHIRRVTNSYAEFAGAMEYRLAEVMGTGALIIGLMSWFNPMVGLEAMNRINTWNSEKAKLDNLVNTAKSQTQTLKSLQERLNRYTDISTEEQLRDMLLGANGYVATGLNASDVNLLVGSGGQLANGTLKWTGGKDALSIDKLAGKDGDPLIQKRAIKDSFGLYIRSGAAPVGAPSTYSNQGYSSDGRLVNLMTSADEFVGSLASLAKSQYEVERDEYYAAQEAAIVRGVKADKKDILDDRDAFFSSLLNTVTLGNTGQRIEYDMYKVLVNDYYGAGNVVDQIYAINESQQRDLQLKVWEGKEKDFQAKKSEWLANVEYLQNTGTARFNDMMTAFNQSWEAWRRDFKKETADGQAAHMARIEAALKEKTEWEVNLLNQARNGNGMSVDEIYSEIQRTLASLGNVPTSISVQNNANKILNNILASKPQVLDNRLLEQGLYADVQFFVDELSKATYDDTNIKKMAALTSEMEDRSKQMAVLQTLDSLWSLPLTFEDTIKEQNKALDEQLSSQLIQDNFLKVGSVYMRSAVDKMGNPTYQILPAYAGYDYKKPDKLPTVKDSSGKEWDLTNFSALQGKYGPTSVELSTMVRLARNQLEYDFKNTFDPEKPENREIGLTLLDPKAMARVAKAAQQGLQRIFSDPQQALSYSQADDEGREAMIESAKNSGYLVGPTVGGSFGTHHFNQFYPILKMKELYNEQKAEGEALKGDGFANAVGGVLSVATGGLLNAKQTAKFMHENGDVIDTIVSVAAVIAAPFTGGASLLALAAYKGIQGAYNGGVAGAITGALSGVANGFTQMVGVTVDATYSYANGFAGSVGVGIGGVATVGVSYSDQAGFGASASVELGPLQVGVTYSQQGGFGAAVGFKNSNGLAAGLAWSESGGIEASVGIATKGGLASGISYNKSEGFGAYITQNTFNDQGKVATSGSLTFTQRDGIGVEYTDNQFAGGSGTVSMTQKGGLNASYASSDGLVSGSAGYNFNDGSYNVTGGYAGRSLTYSSVDGFSGNDGVTSNGFGAMVDWKAGIATSQASSREAMQKISESVH